MNTTDFYIKKLEYLGMEQNNKNIEILKEVDSFGFELTKNSIIQIEYWRSKYDNFFVKEEYLEDIRTIERLNLPETDRTIKKIIQLRKFGIKLTSKNMSDYDKMNLLTNINAESFVEYQKYISTLEILEKSISNENIDKIKKMNELNYEISKKTFGVLNKCVKLKIDITKENLDAISELMDINFKIDKMSINNVKSVMDLGYEINEKNINLIHKFKMLDIPLTKEYFIIYEEMKEYRIQLNMNSVLLFDDLKNRNILFKNYGLKNFKEIETCFKVSNIQINSNNIEKMEIINKIINKLNVKKDNHNIQILMENIHYKTYEFLTYEENDYIFLEKYTKFKNNSNIFKKMISNKTIEDFYKSIISELKLN